MSHELEQREDGTFSYVGARTEAWHKLGKTYADVDGLTVAQVLADLEVGQIVTAPAQATFMTEHGVTTVEDPSRKMTARLRPDGSITPLGVVGEGYTVVDEAEAFGFLDLVIDSGEAQVTSAGLLYGGKQAFCCFTLPEQIMIGGQDQVNLHAFIRVAHDGSLSLTGAVTPIRVVCQNTVVMGLQMASRVWKIRHTRNMKLQVTEARKALDITFKYADEWQRAANKMIDAKVTTDKFNAIIERLYKPEAANDESKVAFKNWEAKQARLIDLFTTAETQETGRGTAWAAFNAIVEFEDWFRPVRGADDAATAKFTRALTEENDSKAHAYKAIQEMVLA